MEFLTDLKESCRIFLLLCKINGTKQVCAQPPCFLLNLPPLLLIFVSVLSRTWHPKRLKKSQGGRAHTCFLEGLFTSGRRLQVLGLQDFMAVCTVEIISTNLGLTKRKTTLMFVIDSLRTNYAVLFLLIKEFIKHFKYLSNN